MIRVNWSDVALRDLAQHTGYIANFNPRAAQQLAADLMMAAARLADFPDIGRPGSVKNTRELPTVWPYVIVYQIGRERVEVLRVWHGAQDRQR